MSYIVLCLLSIFTLLFVRNLLSWLLSMDSYKVHKKRMKQLKFEEKGQGSMDDFLKSFCKPAEKYILPELKPYNDAEITQKLKFIGWDKYFSAKMFVCFGIMLKIVAVLAFLVFSLKSVVVGIIWGLFLFFGLNFIFNNAVEGKKEKLLADFPEFLTITQGFLSSNLTLAQSIENTIKYVSPEWQTILSDFIVDLRMSGINVALENMNNTTGMFEIKLFSSLLRLALEKGSDVKEGIDTQVKNLTEIQQYILEKKVAKRKTLAICVQGPMLIAIFVTFGLPIIGDMTSLGLF